MKIKDLIKNSTELLNKNSILTSKLDVKILLSYILNIERNDLFLMYENELNSNLEQNFYNLLNRRINREPIANIIEKKPFWDYEFYVNKNVLTPRCDSEILIEAVLENFKNKDEKLKILDLGTGSGCLILTLLKLYKNSNGLAIDISDKALEVAQKNAKSLNINNIEFLKNNWNDSINEKFDIIISNPPYIPTNAIKHLEPEVNIFNPMVSLDGGNDGLDPYRYLALNLKKNTKQSTQIFLEIGKDQENDIENIFNNNFMLKKSYKDLGGIIRILNFKIKD